MIKYATAHKNGRYGVKQIKWTPEEYYNHTDIHSSYEAALNFVLDINSFVRQIKSKMQ